MISPTWINIINNLFFVYGSLLIVMYLFNAILSAIELKNYSNRNKYIDYKSMLTFEKLPTISIIAPAYNEEKTIIENIKCLLALQYQNFEIIIVNDGSKDDSLAKIIAYFELVKVNRSYDKELECEEIRAIYQSKNVAFNDLVVVDKANGGKADALNAGINIAKGDLFLAIDVDCLLESDALLKMVKPFLDDSERVVIASGGVIRIANSCEVSNGKIIKVNFPKNFWAKFQVLEYFRAFTLGRMAWSKMNGLLIISGAFGLFDRKRVIKIGGYDRHSVGEDLELVVRLRRYMHEVEKRKYRVSFIPDPLCWTEVPENLKILSRQRNRWTRGTIDTILKHKTMFLNPKYGLVGMFSFPSWILLEWFAPILQSIGLLYLLLVIAFGLLNFEAFITLLIFILTFSIMFSLFAVFFEAYTYHKYRGKSYLIQTFILIILEMIIYQPLNMIFSLTGHFDFYFKKNKNTWGVMTRKGFTEKTKNN